MPRTRALAWTAEAHVDPGRPWATQARAVCGAPSQAFLRRLLVTARRSKDVPRAGRVIEAADLAETILALGCPGVVFLRPLHGRVLDGGGLVAAGCVPVLQPEPVDPETVIATFAARHPQAAVLPGVGIVEARVVIEEARRSLPAIRGLWARAVADLGVRSA